MTDDEISDLWERSATRHAPGQTQVNWFARAIIAAERDACLEKAIAAIADEKVNVASDEIESADDFAYNQALADAAVAVQEAFLPDPAEQMRDYARAAVDAECARFIGLLRGIIDQPSADPPGEAK